MTTPRDGIAGLSERLREQTRHWTGIMSRHPAFLDPELSITMMEAATQLDALSAERDMLRIRVEELEHERNALALMVKEMEGQRDLYVAHFMKEEDCRKIWQARADALSARVKELEGQLRTVQNAAKTIASCQGTELEHLRQNKTFDHKLRAEHESLLTRDAMMTEALEAAESRALRAEQERDELQYVFDTRWDADQRAIKRWQEANPERKPIWPDHADMVVWLLKRDARLQQERDEAFERLKPLSEVVLPWGNVGSGMVSADAVLAARDLVRRLASGPEKEKK